MEPEIDTFHFHFPLRHLGTGLLEGGFLSEVRLCSVVCYSIPSPATTLSQRPSLINLVWLEPFERRTMLASSRSRAKR